MYTHSFHVLYNTTRRILLAPKQTYMCRLYIRLDVKNIMCVHSLRITLMYSYLFTNIHFLLVNQFFPENMRYARHFLIRIVSLFLYTIVVYICMMMIHISIFLFVNGLFMWEFYASMCFE